MSKRSSSPYSSNLRSIYARFVVEKGKSGQADKPVNLNDIFDFAEREQLWDAPKLDLRQRFRRDMARALREDYFTDDRGRTVRRYHAAKRVHIDMFGVAVQEVFWADILRARPVMTSKTSGKPGGSSGRQDGWSWT
jgi:hypothetical protein